MKRTSIKLLSILLALLLVVGLAACSDDDEDDDDDVDEDTVEEEATEAPDEEPADEDDDEEDDEEEASGDLETVTIGAVLPLTGSQSATGANLRAAMEVAQDIINNSHDIDWDVAQNEGIGGYRIELEFADSESDADTAGSEAANLIETYDVPVLVGSYSSGQSASVGLQGMQYGVPTVCGSSSSAALTDGESYQDVFFEWFNRIAANDDMESDEFFEYLDYLNDEFDAGIETVAIAYIQNSYGEHALEMFEQYAGEYGYEIVATVSYAEDATAFDTEASQIASANPDVVFQASYIADLSTFAAAYDSLGFQPQLFMCYCGGFQDASFAERVADLSVSDSFAGGQAASSVLKDDLEIYAYISDLYEEKTGLGIDGVALEEFASVIVAAQAIAEADSTDGADIIDALRSTDFDAPYFTAGTITFNEYGQNTHMASFITQLIDGVYEVVYGPYQTADTVLGGE